MNRAHTNLPFSTPLGVEQQAWRRRGGAELNQARTRRRALKAGTTRHLHSSPYKSHASIKGSKVRRNNLRVTLGLIYVRCKEGYRVGRWEKILNPQAEGGNSQEQMTPLSRTSPWRQEQDEAGADVKTATAEGSEGARAPRVAGKTLRLGRGLRKSEERGAVHSLSRINKPQISPPLRSNDI